LILPLLLAAASPAAAAATLSGGYTGTALTIASGGDGPGSAYSHQIDLAARLGAEDGADGWALSAAGAWTTGRSLSDRRIGDVAGVQATFFGKGVWLTELAAVRQAGGIRIAAGRLSPINAFAQIDAVGAFVNAGFGAAGGGNPVDDPGPTSSPASTWGVAVDAALAPGLTLRTGAYLSDHSRFELRKRGMMLSFRTGTGVLGVAELSRDMGGWRAGVGGWADRARLATFDGGSRRGNEGLYLFADRPADDSGRAALFTVVQLTARGDRNLQPFFVATGAEIPAAWRDGDAVAIGLTAGKFGGECPRNGWEVALEANYRFALPGGAVLRPDLQYVVNPGGTKLRDAMVAGVQLEWGF
jgi:porin